MPQGINPTSVTANNVRLAVPGLGDIPLELVSYDTTSGNITVRPTSTISLTNANNGTASLITSDAASAVQDLDGAIVPAGVVLHSFTILIPDPPPTNVAPTMVYDSGLPNTDVTTAGPLAITSIVVTATDPG